MNKNIKIMEKENMKNENEILTFHLRNLRAC